VPHKPLSGGLNEELVGMSMIGIGTSKRVLLSVALAGAVAFAQPGAALAAHGGGGGFHGGGFGGFHGGGFGGFHAGGFHGGGFDGHRHFGGFGWGGGLGWGAYADPDLYGWGGDDAGSGYGQPYASQYWYYCRNPAGYYPYVTQCSVAWQPVPAG